MNYTNERGAREELFDTRNAAKMEESLFTNITNVSIQFNMRVNSYTKITNRRRRIDRGVTNHERNEGGLFSCIGGVGNQGIGLAVVELQTIGRGPLFGLANAGGERGEGTSLVGAVTDPESRVLLIVVRV